LYGDKKKFTAYKMHRYTFHGAKFINGLSRLVSIMRSFFFYFCVLIFSDIGETARSARLLLSWRQTQPGSRDCLRRRIVWWRCARNRHFVRLSSR